MRTKDVIRAAAFLSALSLLSGLPAAGAAESESAADKEYTQYLEAYDSRTYCYQTVQMEAAELSAGEGTSVEEAYRGREKPALVTSADGYAEWLVQIPQTGFYSMRIEYCSVEGTGGPVQRSIAIDGAIPFDEAGSVKLSRVFRDSEPVQHKDGQNDIRPAQEEIFEWRNEYIRDSQGYVGGRLEFYLTEGSHTIRFSSLAEPVALGTITLESFPEKVAAYSQVEEHYKEKGYQPVEGALEDGLSVVQAEDVYERSDQTLYAISDSSSSFNEPFSYQYQKLNAIGGSKWMNQGQWLSWQIQVPKSGLYKIGFRVKQNYTRDVEPARSLYIDGQLPFQEAASLTFPYQDGWTVSAAGGDTPYLFYLEEGTRTITLEASLGEVSESLRKASASLEALNRANWELLTIIGNRPDTYRDYNFAEYCPQVITTFREQAEILQSIADDWVARTGKQDANVAQIEAIVYQLNTMWKDPDKIAGLYLTFKDNVSNFANLIMNVRQQPLALDYLFIAEPDAALPKADAGFWGSLKFGVIKFLSTFFTDYNNLSAAPRWTRRPRRCGSGSATACPADGIRRSSCSI